VSKYQSTILKFIFLVLTDLILCSLQIFAKKGIQRSTATALNRIQETL